MEESVWSRQEGTLVDTLRMIAHWRMQNLGLTGEPLDTPESVVRRLGAVQSQDYGPGKWSIAQRTTGVGDADLDRAFADGVFLRTHILRPTWHFVSTADIRWMLRISGPRVHSLNSSYYQNHGLDTETQRQCTAVLVRALQGGKQLTRKELGAELEAADIPAGGPRLAAIVMQAELDGLICSGALKGKQHTYALLDERVPATPPLTADEALKELTLRYFTGHGPATVKDFRWWSSLTMTEIKRGLEMAGSTLENEDFDGVTYWFATPAPSAPPPSPRVHLIQRYDEYIVGYSESRRVMDVSGGGRWPIPWGSDPYAIVLLDGQVVGQWRRTMEKVSTVIEVTLFTTLDAEATAALEGEVERYAAFLGTPASLLIRSIEG